MTNQKQIALQSLDAAEKALDIGNLPRALMYLQRCRTALNDHLLTTMDEIELPAFLKKQAD